MSRSEIQFSSLETLLQGQTFLVERYQRGYKWDQAEVEAMLNDFKAHFDSNDGSPYCLQPLVVCERSEKGESSKEGKSIYEVIDGQQRLTTLYLILLALSGFESSTYSLNYKVRAGSAIFLRDIFGLKNAYIDGDEETDNSDIYYFKRALAAIKKWVKSVGFESEDGTVDLKKAAPFLNHIRQKVYFIWYPILTRIDSKKDEQTDQIIHDTFVNLNQGKIRLTGSELIKALFILGIKKTFPLLYQPMKIQQFSYEWDGIENGLNKDSFWFFICNHNALYQQGTRIDYLFDLLKNMPLSKKHDPYKAYRKYEEESFEKKGVDEASWEEVKQLYYQLSDWYEDHETYHLVGFSIAKGYSDANELLEMQKGSTKKAFQVKIRKNIGEKMAKKVRDLFSSAQGQENKGAKNPEKEINEALKNLSYQEKKHHPVIHDILTLTNVEYYLHNGQFFPFDRFKDEETQWTLEHINPQTPKTLKNLEGIKDWLNTLYVLLPQEEDKKRLWEIAGGLENIAIISKKEDERIDLKIRDHKSSSDINFLTSSELNAISEIEGVTTLLHSIMNLALLDRPTNSALQNESFEQKRKNIITRFSDKSTKVYYLPPMTEKVFMKGFCPTQNTQKKNYWAEEDQMAYLEMIEAVLQRYLMDSGEKNNG